MRLPCASRRHCLAGVGLLATLAVAGVDWSGAQARATPKPVAHARVAPKVAAHAPVAHEASKHGKHEVRVSRGSDYHPLFAAIVVDDNTGQAIYEVNADEPRHPASLTKIMTLYVLFEQIEAGNFKLDTPLPVSAARKTILGVWLCRASPATSAAARSRRSVVRNILVSTMSPIRTDMQFNKAVRRAS